VQKKEQLDDFVTSMSAHSDALSTDLESAAAHMRATLTAVHAHTVQVLQFFAAHSYTPPQTVSAALNKAATHASVDAAGGYRGDLSGEFSFGSTGDDGLGAVFLAACISVRTPVVCGDR
jgi:hypothetical protein